VNRHELDEKIHNNTPTIDRVINTLELHVCVKTGIANKYKQITQIAEKNTGHGITDAFPNCVAWFAKLL